MTLTNEQRTQSCPAAAESILQQRHSFTDLAEEHSIPAAILLQYLAHKIAKSTKEIEGRKWHYETIESLAMRYPYLKPSTINDTLNALCSSVLVKTNYNRRKHDRTCWYAFQDDNIRKRAMGKAVAYFIVEEAVLYRLPAAILVNNLRYWIQHHRKGNPEYAWHSMSPGELEECLPLSEATIKRALKQLVQAKVLKSREPEDRRLPNEYAFVDSEQLDRRGLTV
jgi:Fe2+ or Zn2+ uptake regulation protein